MSLTKYLKPISIAAATFVACSSASFVNSEEYNKGVYLNLGLGIGSFSDEVWSDGLEDEFQYGLGFEAGLGYDFGKRFRTEVTYSNTASMAPSGEDINLNTVLFNGFIDFPAENSNYTPFIGLGYGSTNADATDLCNAGTSTDCDESAGTFSISGGVAYAINETTELTAKATYLNLADLDMNDNGTAFTVDGSGIFSLLFGATVRF